jgi:hypothetical protein
MSSGYFEIEPDVVYSGASALKSLSAEASRAALQALTGYSTAAGAVGHPVLSAAFFSFADDHSTLHHSIGPAIDSLATSFAKGTNSVVDGQNESLGVHKGSISAAESATSTNTSQVSAG